MSVRFSNVSFLCVEEKNKKQHQWLKSKNHLGFPEEGKLADISARILKSHFFISSCLLVCLQAGSHAARSNFCKTKHFDPTGS